FVAERAAAEAKRMHAAIGALEVDWSDPGVQPAAAGAASLSARLSPGPKDAIRAGEKVQLELAVTNTGSRPLHRLRAWTESESNPWFDRREFLFGAVAPGATRSWKVEVELPRDLA